MARLFVLVLGMGLLGTTAGAQPDPPAPPSDSAARHVRSTLDRLFDGMRAGDSAAVRAVFHEDARLVTALGPSDTSAVRTTAVDTFVEAVGQSRDAVWDERIWDVTIQVDGPLASAWVPYVFYVGTERSHCGVNAVQLVRQDTGWKILHLTDTRRQTCDVPPGVQK